VIRVNIRATHGDYLVFEFHLHTQKGPFPIVGKLAIEIRKSIVTAKKSQHLCYSLLGTRNRAINPFVGEQ
jgi:hypothetical protein